MTTRTSHFLLGLAAFAAGLVIFLGVFEYATGGLRGGGPGAPASGGPVYLTG